MSLDCFSFRSPPYFALRRDGQRGSVGESLGMSLNHQEEVGLINSIIIVVINTVTSPSWSWSSSSAYCTLLWNPPSLFIVAFSFSRNSTSLTITTAAVAKASTAAALTSSSRNRSNPVWWSLSADPLLCHSDFFAFQQPLIGTAIPSLALLRPARCRYDRS